MPEASPVDLSGAADLHLHFGPDARRPQSVTALQAARAALAAGHCAFVLKAHDQPTVGIAAVVQEVVGDTITVGGGITVGAASPAIVPTVASTRRPWRLPFASAPVWCGYRR